LNAEAEEGVETRQRMLKADENTANDLDKDNHFIGEVYINVKAFKYFRKYIIKLIYDEAKFNNIGKFNWNRVYDSRGMFAIFSFHDEHDQANAEATFTLFSCAVPAASST
jgi:hypothetical protein